MKQVSEQTTSIAWIAGKHEYLTHSLTIVVKAAFNLAPNQKMHKSGNARSSNILEAVACARSMSKTNYGAEQKTDKVYEKIESRKLKAWKSAGEYKDDF